MRNFVQHSGLRDIYWEVFPVAPGFSDREIRSTYEVAFTLFCGNI